MHAIWILQLTSESYINFRNVFYFYKETSMMWLVVRKSKDKQNCCKIVTLKRHSSFGTTHIHAHFYQFCIPTPPTIETFFFFFDWHIHILKFILSQRKIHWTIESNRLENNSLKYYPEFSELIELLCWTSFIYSSVLINIWVESTKWIRSIETVNEYKHFLWSLNIQHRFACGRMNNEWPTFLMSTKQELH